MGSWKNWMIQQDEQGWGFAPVVTTSGGYRESVITSNRPVACR